jgi:hypothetical protein
MSNKKCVSSELIIPYGRRQSGSILIKNPRNYKYPIVKAGVCVAVEGSGLIYEVQLSIRFSLNWLPACFISTERKGFRLNLV